MRAAVLHEIPAAHLAVEETAAPAALEPNDLLLRVEACGICGTDLHILAGGSYRPTLPFVLGHEPVGTVIEAGAASSDRWLGRRVTMTLFSGCGECPECRRGQERICSRLVSISGVLGCWGGYAEMMTIRAAQAVEVPGALTATEAASLVDSGATAANAVRVALERDSNRIAIVGAGPIGHIAAEMLREQDIECVVVQSSEPRRVAIEALGYRTTTSLGEL